MVDQLGRRFGSHAACEIRRIANDNKRERRGEPHSAEKITFSVNPLIQQGGFSATLPLLAKASPGKYSFTISSSAAETCAIKGSSQKLTGSATMTVTATVAKGLSV